MAAAAPTFQSIQNQIATRQLAPVYILHGEEGFYLDRLVEAFEKALPEADREFNQYVLYAPQIEAGAVMDLCLRLPMMADRQMVILKECQAVRADQINKLHKYLKCPSPSTVLVMVFRGDKAKGKDLLAAAKNATTVVFESKKIPDYSILPHIDQLIKSKGLSADQKSLEMLRDFVGNDLSRMHNEIGKLATVLGPGARVTPEAVERNIGISKEYNTFELVDALATRNAKKAMQIVEYFQSNPKANPVIMVTAAIFNYFSSLLVAIYTPDKSDASLMKALDAKSAFQMRRVRDGLRYYNAFQLIEIIWALREFDCRSKGKGSRQDMNLLFHDLIFHILTAQGNLGV